MKDLATLTTEQLLEYKEVVEYNISKYKNAQLAKKVQLNSAYGALGNQYFRFYDIRHAEAVTYSGQLVNRWVQKSINQYLNKILQTKNVDYIIAGDTDSIYITFGSLVEKIYKDKDPTPQEIVTFLDKFSEEKISKIIKDSYETLAKYLNVYSQKMRMSREIIADKGLWTDAKKKYILNIYDNEGVRYNDPKLKVVGGESVKSSTPGICRQNLRRVFELVMWNEEEDLHKFIREFKKEFYSLPPEQISFPRSVNNLKKYSSNETVYSKGCPIHVRGSLVYNSLLKEKKISRKYSKINEGDKIKFCYLKTPNLARENVIAFPDTLPSEFGLQNSIDYEQQFEKSFLKALKDILIVRGWHHEPRASLDAFF